MDAFGVIGFVGTIVGLVEISVRTRHILDKTRSELQRQESEYDVIRLILLEAVQVVSSHGEPTDAIDATMHICAESAQNLQLEFDRMHSALNLNRRSKRIWKLVVASARRNERRYHFEAFRDAVLLLRDLSYR